MSLRDAGFSNWNVSDDDIRTMDPALRQRIRDYEEQRREGQAIARQIAHGPERPEMEEGMRLDGETILFWGPRVYLLACCIAVLLTAAVALLAVIVAELA